MRYYWYVLYMYYTVYVSENCGQRVSQLNSKRRFSHFPPTISITRSAKLVAGRLCQAFTLIRGDGTVVCWGNKVACGQFLGVPCWWGGLGGLKRGFEEVVIWKFKDTMTFWVLFAHSFSLVFLSNIRFFVEFCT